MDNPREMLYNLPDWEETVSLLRSSFRQEYLLESSCLEQDVTNSWHERIPLMHVAHLQPNYGIPNVRDQSRPTHSPQQDQPNPSSDTVIVIQHPSDYDEDGNEIINLSVGKEIS